MRTPALRAEGSRLLLEGQGQAASLSLSSAINRIGEAKWLRLAVVALLALFALAVTVRAQDAGVLEGQVVNGTAAGPQMGAGIPVTLRVNQGENEINSLETTTDANGRFRFDGLDTAATLEYWPEAMYLGVLYPSAEPYRFDAGQTVLNASLTVYETTDDDSAIRLDSVHVIAESFDQVLRISEIHFFGNTGDRTYVGRGGQTVFIPLPEEAVGLAFEEASPGERFVERDTPTGVLDTQPVPPGDGTSLALFSYHLVSTGETVPLQQSFAYPVVDLNVLVTQPGLTLRSDQLQAAGTRSFQGQQYEFYTAQDLAPNTPLVLEFVPVAGATGGLTASGSAAPSGQSATGDSVQGNQALLRWLGFALAGLAVLGAVAYPLAVRQTASARAPLSGPKLAADPKARPLLRSTASEAVADLAALEEAFETGQIDQETYERQRAEKYELLKAVRS
jgi:hypothetical protein